MYGILGSSSRHTARQFFDQDLQTEKSVNEDFSAVIIMPFGAVTDIKMSRLNLIRTTHINLFFLPDFCLGV